MPPYFASISLPNKTKKQPNGKRKSSVPAARAQAVKPATTAPEQSPELKRENHWWHKRLAAVADGHLEYIRTGDHVELNQRLQGLDKECPDLAGTEEPDSAAHRWGIPSQAKFDNDCWTAEFNRRAQGKNPREGDGEFLYVGATMIDILDKLGRHARSGSPSALEAVCGIALCAAQWTERLTREHPEQVRSIAEKCEAFPILVSQHPDVSGKKYIEGKLKALNIGARVPRNPSGFHFRATKEQPYKERIHEMCERLFQVLVTMRDNERMRVWGRPTNKEGSPEWVAFLQKVDSPELDDCPEWVKVVYGAPGFSERTSRTDAEASFDAAWRVLCEATGNRPEELEILKGIGDYKKNSVKAASIRKGRFSNGVQLGLHNRLKDAWLARFVRQK